MRLGPGWHDNVYMGSTHVASDPRDRAGDAWAGGRDRGWAEHGRQDAEWDGRPVHNQEGPEGTYGGGRVDDDAGYNMHASALDERYADLMMDADFHNNPVAQFRHDPEAYINRVGHVHDEGDHNLRMAEYMDLVEANAGIREAAWADVRRKAMRLRAEGRVHPEDLSSDRIYATVEGDTGTYDTMISKKGAFGGFGGGHSISNWHCSCEWGKWAFKRRYTYVGRLCSHGYAAYLTMQSAHMTGKPRQQKLTPYPKRRKRADALQMEPQRLVPEMVVNDTEDEPSLVDVTEDERKTTGPDGIVHFSAAEREILAQRAINEHGAWHLAEDQHDDDWKVEDAADGGRALKEIRNWADRSPEDDLGHMDRRNDEIRDAVEEARDAGTDADQLVASRHYADEQPVPPLDDPYGGGGGQAATPFDSPYGNEADNPGGVSAPSADDFAGGIGGYGDAGDATIGGYGDAPQTGIGGYPAGDPNTIGGYGEAGDTTLGGPTDGGNPSGGNGESVTPGGASGGAAGGDYTVKPGDTLTDIIKNQGSGSSVSDVAQASGISNPDLIHPGETIKGLGGGGSPASPAAGGSSDAAAGTSDASGSGSAGDSGYGSLMGGGSGSSSGKGGGSGAAGTSDSSGSGSMGDSGYSSLMGGGGSSGASNPASPSGLTGGGSSGSGSGLGDTALSNDAAAGSSQIDNTNHKSSNLSASDYREWHIAAYGVPPRLASPGATVDDTDGAPPPADLNSGGSGETPNVKKQPGEADLAAGLSDTGSGSKPSGPGAASPGIGGTNAPGLGGKVAPTDGMGGLSGVGLPGGGLSNLTNMIGEGVGALTSLPGLMGGGGLSGIGSGISGLMNGLGGLTHLFGSNQAEDYRQWHLAAYGTEPRTAAYPEPGDHHPFNGSGWAGDLEVGSSEDAMKSHKYEDVTNLNDTDYAGSPEALRTGGINRVGYGPQRPPVVPEVISERRPTNRPKTAGEVFEFDDGDPYSKTAADFADPADADAMAVRTAAAGGDIVAQFQASGGGAVNSTASSGHDDIAGAASEFLQRTAGRRYSPAEQEALMREGDRGGARNLDELRLEGTHYSMNSVGLL
jgi:hypothetical protein